MRITKVLCSCGHYVTLYNIELNDKQTEQIASNACPSCTHPWLRGTN